MERKTGVLNLKDIFSRMDLQILFENFMACTIDLEKR